MNKLFAVFFLFAFVVTAGFAQAPAEIQSPSQPKIMLDDGTIVGPDNPMPVDAEVNVGSITVDAFPVFADQTGNPATATIDAENRAIVNLGSETVGLKAAIDAVKAAIEAMTVTVDTSALEAAQASTTAAVDDVAFFVKPANVLATQTVALVANESKTINTALDIGVPRKFIEIVAMDNTKEFWIEYGGDAVINACRRVYGGALIELRGGAASINVIASEAISLYVTEGGLQ